MFRLRSRANTPPGGFIWVDPISMQVAEARNHANWTDAANAIRVANRKELASVESMEDQLCGTYNEATRREYCVEVEGGSLNPVLGPGGELKRLLASFGIKACFSCVDVARQMDEWGPDECERRLPEIVVGMTERANHMNWIRFLPFKEIGAEQCVKTAIARSRRLLFTQNRNN